MYSEIFVSIPEKLNLDYLDSPEDVAIGLREYLDLPKGGVHNVTNLIESMGIIRDATKFEMSLKKEIDKDTKLSQEQEVKLKKNKNKRFTREIYHKKHARKTTITGSDGAKIVSGKTHTSQSSTTKRVSPNKKVSAKKTTRKK